MKEYPLYIKATCYMLIISILILGMHVGRSFLIPAALSILFAFLLMPVSRWLESKKTPKLLAIVISILLLVLLVTGLIFFLSNQVMSLTEDMPMLKQKLSEKLALIQSFISDRFNISEKRQIEWLEEQLANAMQSSGKIFGDIFSATGNFLAVAALIPIYIFFFTYYKHKFVEFVKHLTPESKHNWVREVMQSTSKVSQKYLVGLLIDVSILSVLNSIGFLALGINHAILLGVIAGFLNIIPYIGVLIGSLFPIAMALLTKDSIWIAVGALGVCVVVQFLDNNFITPNVVGSSVSINPLATLIALLIGGMIWGVAGMMLFIPYLGMLKVIFDNVDSLKPFGYLIGEEAKLKKKKRKILRINI